MFLNMFAYFQRSNGAFASCKIFFTKTIHVSVKQLLSVNCSQTKTVVRIDRFLFVSVFEAKLRSLHFASFPTLIHPFANFLLSIMFQLTSKNISQHIKFYTISTFIQRK